jgi:hypothetical protein
VPVAARAIHLLGVRHHGPGSARSLLRALDGIRPSAVLVELPADVEPLLGWVGEPGMTPPVSLLGWVVAEPAQAAFLPFAAFSPEWQAIRWAHEHGAELRAIDLPLANALAAERRPAEAELLADRVPIDPLRELALAAGDPDPERWWDDVIEHRGDGEPAFDAVAEAMRAAREGTITGVAEERREAHMRRAIRRAVRDGHEQLAVVVGAWHVPALDLDAHPTSADTASLRALPKSKIGLAWVPWTHRRLTSVSGYGAGVESPGWYAHVFDHPGVGGVGSFFVESARLLRSRGLAASPDHLIAGTRLADSLAARRGRPRPGLDEVLDAADAVMGGLHLLRDELVVGDALGRVPASAPQVPLARDLARAQRSARLRPEPGSRTVELDLRTPSGMRKSHLLHRLLALGVPWGVPEEGRGSSGTFRETWRVAWEPELSVRLVELAAYGTTIESAATARLVERATATASLAELVGVLEQALLAELPAAVDPAVRQLSDRAATDPDVGHLMDALVPLASALRYGDVRGSDAASLRTVFDGLVVRVVAGIGRACASLDDEAAATMIERLTSVQMALAVVDHEARRAAYPDALAALAEGRRVHGLVQGRACRLLHDAGAWSTAGVQQRLSRALTPGTPPAAGAAFVEGFLAGSGTVLLHDHELLAVVDGWLASLTTDAFDGVVALLRRTFGSFEPAERRQLMRVVTGAGVARSGGFGDDVDARRAGAVLVTVRAMLGLVPGNDADDGGDEDGDDDGHRDDGDDDGGER